MRFIKIIDEYINKSKKIIKKLFRRYIAVSIDFAIAVEAAALDIEIAVIVGVALVVAIAAEF